MQEKNVTFRKIEAPDVGIAVIFGGFLFYVVYLYWEDITLSLIVSLIGALISFLASVFFGYLAILQFIVWPAIALKRKRQIKACKKKNNEV